jgi:signal transduction histidine kinase
VHPQILDDLGLVPALRHLARRTGEDAQINVAVTDGTERDLSTLPGDVAAALYRVAREATANAIRHGAARTIDVRVGLVDGEVTMQVEDDGSGFDVDSTERKRPGMGIFTMRERVGLLNGRLEIASTRTTGTSVSVRIPLSRTPASPVSAASEQRTSFNTENQHAR